MIHGDCTCGDGSKKCASEEEMFCVTLRTGYRFGTCTARCCMSTSPEFGLWWGISMVIFMVWCSYVSVSSSMQWNFEGKIWNQMKIDVLEEFVMDIQDEWTVMRTVWNISYG